MVAFSICEKTFAQFLPVVPPEWRSRIDAERSGIHDANSIRTMFYNFGMVGDYPLDPINVDLTVFHSVEIPKGSGENYSDGTTPFVLARVRQITNRDASIMLTGFRERQGTSPISNKTMRFEPRFGYFQPDPAINRGRSVALSSDPRTWPVEWYDKLNDPHDPGWRGFWNGYFGKAPRADQESFVVYDDNFYDAWEFYPDSRDITRRGLGLKVEQRGFQWANPQASYVIFFHYDIANESTTDYSDNIIFGLYMDSGVGGSGIGRDGVPESDDDNAFFDRAAGLNLVYTWDKNGNGMRGKTGYLGYSYLETPGNSVDPKDNDMDGITNERRDGGPGAKIIGQDAIRNYVLANYNFANFEAFYGPLTTRPAFIQGIWWTGDEEMDWVAEHHDTGADGIFGTNDPGEKDGIPTDGETNFDRTDIDESDQIGLTGFKMNRIRAGVGSPSTAVDDIVFFDDGQQWPMRLYNIFTHPDSAFDSPLVLNYNIGFLFASGTFTLKAGKTERFSLAMGFGEDLRELRNTTRVVQQIYKANYQFAVPPPMPTLKAYTGDGFVTLTWDNVAERAFDPITMNNDFEGYRLYRSTDPAFLDPQVIYTGTGTRPIGHGRPIAQFDLVNGIAGFSPTQVEGVAYFLGDDSGLKHTFTDTTVVNGQRYFYAITAYDRGVDSIFIYPSENAISLSQTLRGGLILPINAVEVFPNPKVPGYVSSRIANIQQVQGRGVGEVNFQVLNSNLIPDGDVYELRFFNQKESIIAETYSLVNITKRDTIFEFGRDFTGSGTGPVGDGILPIIKTNSTIVIDSAKTGFSSGSRTNLILRYRYAPALPITLRRPGFPNDIEIVFSDQVLDTSLAAVGIPAINSKFKIVAKTDTGDFQLDFRFRDLDNSGSLNQIDEFVEVITRAFAAPTIARATWRFEVDTVGLGGTAVTEPTLGDHFNLRLKLPYSSNDLFRFSTLGATVEKNQAKKEFENEPYVVPNPYVGAASFEPQRFAVDGRGERKIEFRNIPLDATIRIFTVSGELVKKLRQDGSITAGFVAWNLRNEDNLEVAPGLYIYQVDGGEVGTFIGKFAIIK